MAREQVSTLLDPIRRLIGGEGGAALSDAELLQRFVASADATAFEVLVWRHGAMVLGLCRRILRDSHEAEDAFQATFLVFARKAGSISRRDAVGCWLHKAAYRIALRLRASAGRRPATGEVADELPAPEQDDADWRDLRPVLDEEIARLPEKYRAAFVLCYLEGRTNEEAAVQLGCPKGTILSRLARGREWLRTRLTRRGVALSAVALTTTLSGHAASAAVPAALTRSLVNAAIPFAAGKAAGELVSATAAALTEGVLRTMILIKVKIAALALLSLTAMGAGVTWATTRGGGESAAAPANVDSLSPTARLSPAPKAEAPEAPESDLADSGFILDEDRRRTPTPAEPQEQGRGRGDEPNYSGKVVAIAKDGKSFTIESPPKTRGEEAGKQEIKITQKTAITYNGVAENGAKLTEGYRAQVHLESGSKDVAVSVAFMGAESERRGPDFWGEVAGSTKDSITLIPAGPRGERGTEPKRETIPIDGNTVVAFSNVAAGQAKITDGCRASVWLADDGKTAAKIQILGMAGDVGRRDEKRPDLNGKVVEVAPNGKQITVAKPAGGRGLDGGGRYESVKFGDKTTVIYNNVQANGTKPAVDYHVQVWFAEGSKDTAAKVVFAGIIPERWTTISGKATEISEQGKEGMTIEVEQPGAGRGGESKRLKIKVPASARLSFYAVGPNEAKPVVGYDVQLRLKDGSTDTAASATFFKVQPRQERNGRQ